MSCGSLALPQPQQVDVVMLRKQDRQQVRGSAQTAQA